MALVSMDVTDANTGMAEGYDSCPRLYLTAVQVAALGITTPPRAGTQFTLTAVVEVEETRERSGEDEKGPEIALTLDVEYAEISPAPKGKAAQLYADE